MIDQLIGVTLNKLFTQAFSLWTKQNSSLALRLPMFIYISDLMAMSPSVQENPGIMGQVVLFGIIFFIFFFLVIRPQQQKAKQHEGMLGELNKNDKIITASGIYGTIDKKPDADDTYVFISIADKTVIKIQKSQINEMVKLPTKKDKENKK